MMQLLPVINRDTLFVLLQFLGLVADNAEDKKGDDGENLFFCHPLDDVVVSQWQYQLAKSHKNACHDDCDSKSLTIVIVFGCGLAILSFEGLAIEG